MGLAFTLALRVLASAPQDLPSPSPEPAGEPLARALPAPEEPADPLGDVLARAEELSQDGYEAQALDLLIAAFERREGGTLEELALMAEISLDLWLHADAAQVAVEALLREGLSLSPEALHHPVVRRLARAHAKGLYFEARSLTGSAEVAEETDPDVMSPPEMLSAAAEELSRLTAGGTDDPEDFYWLAAVLVEMREGGAARAALTRYQDRVPEERRLPGIKPMERCIEEVLQPPADPKGGIGDLPKSASLAEESVEGSPQRNEPEQENLVEVQAPRKIEMPMPGFTEAARRAAVQGAVILQAVITSDGRPICIRPRQGLPFGLTEKAAEAALRWRFEPARSNGRPVAVYYNLTVNYRLGQ